MHIDMNDYIDHLGGFNRACERAGATSGPIYEDLNRLALDIAGAGPQRAAWLIARAIDAAGMSCLCLPQTLEGRDEIENAHNVACFAMDLELRRIVEFTPELHAPWATLRQIIAEEEVETLPLTLPTAADTEAWARRDKEARRA